MKSLCSRSLAVDYCTPKSPELLKQLYDLDVEAYGSQAAPLSVLQSWVSANPQSIGLICDGSTIAGAYGLLPLSVAQTRHFIAGVITESDLVPLSEDTVDHQFWYWSGIVVRPEYRGVKSGVLRQLMAIGMGGWLSSKAVGYDNPDAKPLYLYATGCTPQGQALIDRFCFEKIRDDVDAPLYVKQINNRKNALLSVGRMLTTRMAARSAIEELDVA